MTYQKIVISQIVEQLNSKSWEPIKQEINRLTGFLTHSESSNYGGLMYKTTNNRVFSFDNFYQADFLRAKKTGITFKQGEFELLVKYRKVYVIAGGVEYTISTFEGFFTCPSCSKEMKIDGVPERNSYYSTSICKGCQKKWLHKFSEYRNAYENSMMENHGVKRPFQKKEFLEKACDTRMKLYGVPYPMQRQEVKDLHAANMMEKWGRKNYFSGLNAWKVWPHKRGMISRLETAVSKACVEIFGNAIQCCITGKSKFFDGTRYYSPDFYDPQRDIIIEFNGDFFHANPALYDDGKIFNKGKTFEVVRSMEDERYNVLKTFSKQVYVVWEIDWRLRQSDVLDMLRSIRDANDAGTLISREKLLGWQP